MSETTLTLTDFLLARIAEDEAVAQGATPGPWLVLDMDEAGHRKDEPMNDPGMGWYWVWAESRLPFYGGVLQPEREHPEAIIGSASIDDGNGGKQEQADAAHIARHDPARVLAECEAKRRIVELHQAVDHSTFAGSSPVWECRSCATGDPWEGYSPDDFPCDTLRAVGSVYADHPDYRQEWKP